MTCYVLQAGMLLSEYFYDVDRLEPEIQDKLQAVLKDWQAIFLDGKGKIAITYAFLKNRPIKGSVT